MRGDESELLEQNGPRKVSHEYGKPLPLGWIEVDEYAKKHMQRRHDE